MGLVVILLFFGLAGGVVGRIKGSSFFTVVPDLGARAVHRAADRRLLPLGEPGAAAPVPGVRQGPQAPRHGLHTCGTELEFPDVAIASEAMIRERRAAGQGRVG